MAKDTRPAGTAPTRVGEHAIHAGDCVEVMNSLDEASIDAVVCDPPYGLGFMSKKWDVAVPGESWARACLRVLKPGGHLVAFGGTRTVHRLAVAIEDGGFEIRDQISWLYWCLSDDTEILIDGRWEPFTNATRGRLALCYDVRDDSYSWQPITHQFVAPYEGPMYRVHSAHTDQLVTPNHRCLIERDGAFAFEEARIAARQREALVAVLEGVRELLGLLPVPDEGASGSEQDVLEGVRECDGWVEQQRAEAETSRVLGDANVFGMREGIRTSAGVVAENHGAAYVQQALQRKGARAPSWQARHRARGVDCGVACELPREDDRREQSGMEGWRHLFPQARELQVDQVCSLPVELRHDGSKGRLRHGASIDCGGVDWSPVVETRGSSPRGPRPAKQCAREPGAIRYESGPQTVRASRHTRTTLARFERQHYDGIVWCVTVPTGAFVVRRNGQVFVTGNSGFPKSLNISKAIDKAAGAKREVVGETKRGAQQESTGRYGAWGDGITPTAPATDAAKQWDGWGTALKPSIEPAVLARKPLSEPTVAANVLKHGTGALNIDGCRIPYGDPSWPGPQENDGTRRTSAGGENGLAGASTFKTRERLVEDHELTSGRWPANIYACRKARRSEREAGCEHLEPVTRAEAVERAPGSAGASNPRAGANGERGHAAGYGSMGVRVCNSCGNRTYSAEAWPACGHEDYFWGNQIETAPIRNYHPTVKPRALMAWLCRLVTPPGGVVLDPFLGSGTTLLAAHDEGLRGVGIELDPGYVKIATARLEDATRQGRLF